MPVTVRIVPVPEPVKVTIKPKTPPPTVTLELDIRKSLSGDLMIFDHGDIDIVLSGKDKKITAFPKQTMTDFTYGAQNRLFAHLARKGIVIPESIQGGSYYGAMEAQLQEAADGKLNAAKFALVSIEKFITNDFLVSIDNNVFGNFFLNFSSNLYTLFNSFFGGITLDPGLVDSPPISIISAPVFFRLFILLIAFK